MAEDAYNYFGQHSEKMLAWFAKYMGYPLAEVVVDRAAVGSWLPSGSSVTDSSIAELLSPQVEPSWCSWKSVRICVGFIVRRSYVKVHFLAAV